MAMLPILEFPDPRLRTRAEPVQRFDAELKQLVADMYETMYGANGVGLAATQVNVGNASRGPLLLISGEADNTVPPVLVQSTLRAYSRSQAVTELKSFAGRGHSLVIDSGWREIAEFCLSWLQAKSL